MCVICAIQAGDPLQIISQIMLIVLPVSTVILAKIISNKKKK